MKVPLELKMQNFRINCACGWLWRHPLTESANEDAAWRSHKENMAALRAHLRWGQVREGLAPDHLQCID